ncbi:MAG: PilZ domain-containing protein [Acidobacteria bacterium]|nr:PilZ domain-containing protein [Acidobacteriota bacterium]
MERRRSPRLPVDLPAALTVLGDSGEILTARVQDLSGHGACVLVERSLPAGACVELDLEDSLYLGEVIYCREVEGGFQAGLDLEHALYALDDLHRLMQSLLAENINSRRDFGFQPEPKSKVRH